VKNWGRLWETLFAPVCDSLSQKKNLLLVKNLVDPVLHGACHQSCTETCVTIWFFLRVQNRKFWLCSLSKSKYFSVLNLCEWFYVNGETWFIQLIVVKCVQLQKLKGASLLVPNNPRESQTQHIWWQCKDVDSTQSAQFTEWCLGGGALRDGVLLKNIYLCLRGIYLEE
jgi:hypothetical protein